MESKGEKIGKFVRERIAGLEASNNDAAVRRSLAILRRGIGKAPGSMAELWDMTLKDLPESFYRKEGIPSDEEWAVYIALTLYALHQQGNDIKQKSMNKEDVSLGTAVRILDKLKDSDSAEESADEDNAEDSQDDNKRRNYRFDRIITSQSITELSNHLRGMVQLLKQSSVPLDYALLAKDIYRFRSDEGRDRVRLKWGQDYYRRETKENAGNEPANDNQND